MNMESFKFTPFRSSDELELNIVVCNKITLVNKLSKNLLLVFITLLLMGCGVQGNEPFITASPIIITATLPPASTPPASATSLPPLPPPTITPIEGITSTQLNVRAEPSTASNVLGIVPANTQVQIIGKDPGENWWQILYPQGDEGKGWVTAEFVTTAGKPEVPEVGGAASDPGNANAAIIQQKLNIRSGPGTDFNSIGTLNPQDVVNVTGKDSNGAWLQIDFANGPEGKGWINAAFVQINNAENLPIVSESGVVVGTGTPVDTPAPPTPTVVPAPMDHDSTQAPAINIVFSATGTRSIQYTSDVSAPTGDTDDWLTFTPFTHTVQINLICTGNGNLSTEIFQNNLTLPDLGRLSCGESRAITTNVGTAYLVHIQALESSGLNYTHYTVHITSIP